MKSIWLLMVLIAALALTISCGDDDDPADTNTDAGGDTDTDADTDADTDTDTDTDACTADLLGLGAVTGTCQDAADDCPGGFSEGAEAGTCTGDLVCCIGEDQCTAALMGMAVCQEIECALGLHMGCPAGGYCCIQPDVPTTTPVEDETCSLSFVSMLVFYGVCTDEATECPAGTFPDFEAANCDTGLNCCIGADQCLGSGGGMFTCEATACEMGFQAGCPDGGYCCFGGMPTTK